MIDKLTPRFLDKSTDEKLVQKTSFIDALNVYVDGDIDSESAGVIKAIKGMSSLTSANTPYFEGTVNNWFCLGHVTDQNTGIVYFFMVSSQSENHGIWAYDHRGVLPTRTLEEGSNYTFTGGYDEPKAKSLHRIATSHHFNFPTNGYVAADIVYANSNEFAKHGLAESYPEKDVLLYFTDNKNEPRMVNVYRAYMNNGLPSDDRQEINDFICACPRVPLKPITFTFKNDPDVVVNNFAAAPGFQFAYQNIYKDGLESAISPYSAIAFPPSIINRGASQKDNILAHNLCELTIPTQNSEVESVRILARYGNGANFVEIDEVDNPNDGEPIKFNFLNDRVAGGVSTQTTDKTFDNLPRKAESQTVVSNRLVYGNYVEGFDNVDCSEVKLEPIYLERPLELLDYSFDIKPSIELTGNGVNYTSGDVQNKTIGFKIDADQFADTIEANTLVKVSFTFAPDKNFHVYTTTNKNIQNSTGGLHESYHQSRQVGERSLNLPGYNTSGISDGSAAAAQENKYQSQAKAGAKYLQQSKENYFGNNKGLGIGIGGNSEWKTVLKRSGFGDGNQGVSYKVSFGTSAGNPLILQGGSLNFSVEFTINQRVSSGAKNLLLAVVTGLLSGDSIDEISSEEGFASTLVTVNDDGVKNTYTHTINLGLSDYDKIPSNSDIGSMICGGHVRTFSNSVEGLPPQLAFVVNKAEVPFYLERVPETTQRFRICIENVYVDEDDSIVTCVRDLDPYSPWFAITPTTLDSPDFEANFQSIWSNYLTPSPRVFRPIPWTGNPQSVLRNFMEKFPIAYNTDDGYPSALETDLGEATMGNSFGVFQPRTIGERKAMLSHTGGVDGAFKFSLLDGEGGPGGKGSPGDAYDLLGCENYGSIAAQVFIEYDKDSISKAKSRGYVAYAFSGNPDGIGNAEGVTEHLALRYINNPSIVSEFNDAEAPLDTHDILDGAYLHISVLQGPLYTGKIVINNINASASDASVAYVNPAGTSMPTDVDFFPTTTLPLVWFSSWTAFDIDEGNAGQNPLILDPSTPFTNDSTNLGGLPGFEADDDYSGYQVSFPYPIVQGTLTGGSGGFVDGDLVSGDLVEDPFGIGINSVDFERLHSHCELGSATTNVELGSFQGGASFKAGATHEFGIVYYDERGRHGYVNPIGSVFIKTLGERDDANKRGAAFVKASNIKHTPPTWAKSYRFAYSKNTSIDKFIQYSAGGAFVANSDYEGGNPSEIYVSLNYLQGHPISYANSFGAKGRDGTPVLYSFTPGDRLRVISYMLSQTGNDISRVYPNNVEFEVTGVTQFTDTNNPFSYTDLANGQVVTTEAMKGLFLVLKNNIDAQGFRYQDIDQGGDNWGNNCIFEIYSPAREVDSENRLYYEIGDTYPIVYADIDADGDGEGDGQYGYFHKNEEVLLTQGDVFFRRHAVNLRDFEGFNGFVDLLDPVDNEDEEVASEANFKSYYLESEAATDLFPSRAISIGRPNVIKLDARESKRQSSLIHSERDVVESSKVGYSSFNRTIASDLEIDFKAGPIHYMCNHQDSIFFIQNNKCGHIPVDRTLISDAAGSQSLIASSKFLGTPRYYAGDAGCDGDPESVVNIDTTAYFVNKSIGKVYKVHPANGVNVISDNNMSGFFRSELASAVEGSKRIIGGYDPVKKEYLLSIVDYSTISYSAIQPELDENVFTPVTVTTSDGGGFDATDILFEEEQDDDTGELFPAVVRFDWSIPSNLNSPEWSLVYEDGDIDSPDDPNIIAIASTWQTSPNGAPSTILSSDLALRCTVENPHNLPSSAAAYLISFEGASDIITSSSWNFTFNLEDESDFALVRSITLPYVNNEVGNNWHFRRDFETGYQEECFLPVSSPGGQGNSFQLTVLPTGLVDNLDVTYQDGDVRSFDIPIRFVCRYEQTDGGVEDSFTPFEILQAFVIGNAAQTSCVVSDRIKIQTLDLPFKIGSTQNNNTSVIRDLTGNISWQASEAYADLNVDIDVGGGGLIPFNPCNPFYGMNDYLEDDGSLSMASVSAWTAASFDGFDPLVETGPLFLWLSSSGVDVGDGNSLDYDFIGESLENALSDIIQSGEPLGCLISSLG